MTEFENCIEYIFQHRAYQLHPEAFAEVLDRLIWCMEDNGEQIAYIQQKWLESDDQEKVKIALTMKGLLPIKDRAQLSHVLMNIEGRWPELKDLCKSYLALWTKQLSGKQSGW
jgi:hypothetical protein